MSPRMHRFLKSVAAREEGEAGFRIPTTFFDLISILLGLFMFISYMQTEMIKHEYQVKVDLLKKQTSNAAVAQPDVGTPTLSVVPTGSTGQYSFIVSARNAEKRIMNVTGELRDYLAQSRPSKIILRVDRNVPSGIMQEVIVDCQERGILPFISVKN